MAPVEQTVEIDGHTLKLTNLAKVLYPEAGFTKAEVIDYYLRIAPVMLAHTEGRCVTFRRYPDGVAAESFFEKRCPKHRPDWLGTYLGPGDRRGGIDYCALEERAALVWSANLAAIELHTPMARAVDLDAPQMVVFDLDPGPDVGIDRCCEVALALRELMSGVDLAAFPKTSGSKGLQVYVPLNTEPGRSHSHDHCSSFALAAASVLEKREPRRVTTSMAKSARGGRVFIDWSQNSRHKTTICAYSLRARSRPTVSTPLGWDEVVAGAEGAPLVFLAADVLERVDRLGDLFAPTLRLSQHLPGA